MPYLLRYGDIEIWYNFEKWPSPRYAQFLKIPPSIIVKPYVYVIQINSQTFLSTNSLRVYRAGPGLLLIFGRVDYFQNNACRVSFSSTVCYDGHFHLVPI